jgi:hypothetical protein
VAESGVVFLVKESPEGGFEAAALEQLRGMVQDAVRCHVEDVERPRMLRRTRRFCGQGEMPDA